MVPKNVVIGLVGSVVLGVVSGLLLGSTAVGYWIAQVVAVAGGFLGGAEHTGWRPGLVRGLVSGAVYGAAILVVRAMTGWSDEVDLGSAPGLLVVITTVIGLLLGAAGGAFRARRS
ncbi:hypothetical protein GCM10009795_009240 [Nocardioides hankookensis]|uniref:TIGR04086 family membrane protein n=1 Tax=Nocardioides hankookensis TaxID=443157 RepID=A0ABW1LIM7_9ACTN